MSKVRNPTFRITNASTHICGRIHQRSLAAAMVSPEFGGHGLKLNSLLHHWIVAVPLHKVGSSHECTVLARASVVMPEIEVDEIDTIGEWQPGQHSVLAQSVHDVLRGVNAIVGGLHHL